MPAAIRLSTQLRQLRTYAQVKGPGRTLLALIRLLFGKRRPRVIEVHPFDLRYGVDTSGLIPGWEMPSGHPHDVHSTAYFGVPPAKFEALLARWRTTPGVASLENWTFVDLGSGKGRAVLIASTLPFRAVQGIELSAGLATLSQRNLEHWRAAGREVAPASILCGDAVDAVDHLPLSPLVLFIANPFDGPVLNALLRALVARREHHPAPVDLLYFIPKQEAVFASFPEYELLWREDIASDETSDGIFSSAEPCSCYRLRPA